MAADYFLHLDGITGESKDDKHVGDIDIESFSWGLGHPAEVGHGGGRGVGKPQLQDLQLMAMTSKASPQLIQACASGTHVKSAKLSLRRAGGKGQDEFLTFSLSDVLITAYQISGSEGGGLPADSISLSFGRIMVEYKEQKADGSLGASTKAGWDVAKNIKL